MTTPETGCICLITRPGIVAGIVAVVVITLAHYQNPTRGRRTSSNTSGSVSNTPGKKLQSPPSPPSPPLHGDTYPGSGSYTTSRWFEKRTPNCSTTPPGRIDSPGWLSPPYLLLSEVRSGQYARARGTVASRWFCCCN